MKNIERVIRARKNEVKEWETCIRHTGSDPASRAGLALAKERLALAQAKRCQLACVEGCAELFGETKAS